MALCDQCGMDCSAGAYHPFAACLMYKACGNEATVAANLAAVEGHGAEAEKDRLRPLLKRCLAELEYFKAKYSEFRPPLLADLRRELGEG